jgi:hypothetical protein
VEAILRVRGSHLKRHAEPHYQTSALAAMERNLSQLRRDKLYSIVISSCAPLFIGPSVVASIAWP